MATDGLVRRRADSRDLRRSYVRLSPKGLEMFEQLHGRSHELERRLASVLDRRDVETTVRVLATLRSFLEGKL
jgi:DNA-binding MarR family transcriptional regulator